MLNYISQHYKNYSQYYFFHSLLNKAQKNYYNFHQNHSSFSESIFKIWPEAYRFDPYSRIFIWKNVNLHSLRRKLPKWAVIIISTRVQRLPVFSEFLVDIAIFMMMWVVTQTLLILQNCNNLKFYKRIHFFRIVLWLLHCVNDNWKKFVNLF